MPSTMTKKKTAGDDAYCPHCHLLIERKVGEEWPKEPLRCPHCRLLVGSGRARPTPSAEPGARGSAAGVFAHEAKRSGVEPTASKEDVCQAIRDAAEAVGARPERLLMVDYQQRVSDDERLPGLSDVFAAYGSWKAGPPRGGRVALVRLAPPVRPHATSLTEGRVPLPWNGSGSSSRSGNRDRGRLRRVRAAPRSRARPTSPVAERGVRARDPSALRGNRDRGPGGGARVRGRVRGGGGQASRREPTPREEEGRAILRTRESCHTLAAVNARGVTGPDLDDLGGLDRQRVRNAIRRGGTGQGRMPAGLLQSQDAQDVAIYVSAVAGQ